MINEDIEITPEMIEAGLDVCSDWDVENVADQAIFVRALCQAVGPHIQRLVLQNLRADRKRKAET